MTAKKGELTLGTPTFKEIPCVMVETENGFIKVTVKARSLTVTTGLLTNFWRDAIVKMMVKEFKDDIEKVLRKAK